MKADSFILPVFLLLLLSCCTTNAPYPEAWPEITQNSGNKCLDLEGSYKNNNDESFLSDLFSINTLGTKEDVTIELKIKDSETLSVLINQSDKDPANHEITYEKHEYTCKDGVIYFKRDREYYLHQVVMATSRADVQLFNSQEFIIAKLTHRSYTLAMLVLPIKNNNIKWEKWEKINRP